MKYLILTLISLIILLIIASCGLIHTTAPVDKEVGRIAKEYGGLYVFEPKFRDEVEEIQQKRYILFVKAFKKALRSKGIKSTKTTYGSPLWEQLNTISRDVHREVDETYPQTLSNGSKYYDNYRFNIYDKEFEPYYQKIKEYMGEEVYNKLKGGLRVTSYYVDEENKEIPITLYTYIYDTITTYGLYGDEGAGFRLTDTYSVGIAGGNIFYLENGKFIKSDEKGKGARR